MQDLKQPLLVALFALALISTQSWAEQRYISDTIYVPLRSGQGSQFRILHKGLRSGTHVTLLDEGGDSGWSQVRTRGGTEGWVPSRYLADSPSSRELLEAANQRMQLLDSENKPLLEKIDSLTTERNQLRTDLESSLTSVEELQTEIAEIRQISANSLQLDRSNRELSEETELLKNKIEVLEADNSRLRDTQWRHWFINGVYATGMGGLLTLLLPRLLQRRRRNSEWV